LDDEQRKWQKQYISSLGSRELWRLAVAVIAWLLIGVVISVITGSSVIFDVFFVTLFVFAFIAPKWKPAYSILRKIAGNEDLPTEPFPRATNRFSSQSRPWWSYLPSIWWLLIDLLLLLAVLGYLSKK